MALGWADDDDSGGVIVSCASLSMIVLACECSCEETGEDWFELMDGMAR